MTANENECSEQNRTIFIGCLKIRFILQRLSTFEILRSTGTNIWNVSYFRSYQCRKSVRVGDRSFKCVFVRGFKEFRVRVDVQVCGPQNIASEIFRLAHARVEADFVRYRV